MALYTQSRGADSLAPSELIALRGEKLSLSHPAEAAFAAAFLSAEQAGAIRLIFRNERLFYILWSRDILYAEKGPNSCAWPEHGIESLLPQCLDKKPAKIRDIVYKLLKTDASNPQEQAMGIIRAGLHSRGLMELQKVKFLKIFTRNEYKVPEQTQAILANIPVEPVHRLLANTQQLRPDIWKHLVKQIRSGISRRTIVESGGGGDGGS